MNANIMVPPFLAKAVDTALNPDATVTEMLHLVLYLAVFWALFFYLFTVIVRPLVYGKPWLIAAGERFYARGGKEEAESFGFSTKKEEFIDHFMTNWPDIIAVSLQHLIGGLLCLPSLCGFWLDNGVATSLACLGVLSEMGWELEHTLMLLYKRYFTKGGKKKVSGIILIIVMFHHSLSTILGLPVILHYRDSKTLHWLCFDLQVAGAATILAIEYTKLLDVGNPTDLFKFQIVNFLLLVVNIWTRAFHWVYLVVNFCKVWYDDEAYWFLGIGVTVTLVFTVFNVLFCIIPIFQRWVKFALKTEEFKALPSDIDEGSRRKSIVELQKVANNVLMDFQVGKDLMELFGSSKGVERRHTMPPQRSSGRRSSAAILLRASVADVSSILTKMD
jgi:hypothetical protein